jgi:hypothetical protein
MELLDAFYYPQLDFILQFVASSPAVDTALSEHILDNFLGLVQDLNEPNCSRNMQKVDTKKRNEITRSLFIITQVQQSLKIRCRAKDVEKLSLKYQNFQKYNCFPELDSEDEKVLV